MAARIRIPLREHRPNHLAMQRTLMNGYFESRELERVRGRVRVVCGVCGVFGELVCGKSAKRVENNRLSRFALYLMFYLSFDLLLLSS